MNKMFIIIVTLVVTTFILILFLRESQNEVKILNATVENWALKYSSAQRDNDDLEKSISSQNKKIEKISLDLKTANETIKNQKPKIVEKWRTKTEKVYINNSTCEQKLDELDMIDASFFKERNR
ncbi:MAG: hypothetical protein ACK5LP_05105 [Campylobacteraceae bacterium]